MNKILLFLLLVLIAGCGTLDRNIEITAKGKGIKCPYAIINDGEITFKKTTHWTNQKVMTNADNN